jgi:hypothetical protein
MDMRIKLASQETHFISCLPRGERHDVRHRSLAIAQHRYFPQIHRYTCRTNAIGRQLSPAMIKRYTVISDHAMGVA